MTTDLVEAQHAGTSPVSRPIQDRGSASVAAPSVADLEAFAAQHATRRGPQCQGCRLPEDLRAALRAGRAQSPPHPYPTLAAYATAKGHKISASCLRDHFGRGHEA